MDCEDETPTGGERLRVQILEDPELVVLSGVVIWVVITPSTQPPPLRLGQILLDISHGSPTT